MRLLALCLSMSLALLAPATASAQLTKEALALEAFGRELDNASTAPDFVGLAVAVVKKGEIVLMRTYGVREAGGHDRVTPDTVFRLASLSKGFASTLAVLEQSEGKLDLQTRITTLVPEFRMKRPGDAARVTLEDVLSQRTGLPPYAYDNLLEAGTPPSQILSAYGKVKQTCGPGECYTYQNVAFNMITMAIERATGRAYPNEVRDRLFGPLGMRTASIGLSDLEGMSNWARPHRRVGDGWVSVPVTDYYYKVPAAGGVNASITDLAKWMIAHMGYRTDVLSKAVLDEVHRKRINTPPETSRQRSLKTPVTETSYGLGWRSYTYAGRQLLTHSGSVEGYISQIGWLPDQDAGIVILSNTRGSRAAKIMPAWLDYQLGLPKTDWFRLSEIAEAAIPPANASGD